MAVSRDQRFTVERPCPVCGGHDRLPPGHGVRCFGFLSSDGLYAHCSREESAHGLEIESDSQTYAHRLDGPCRCGRIHGDRAPTPIRPESTKRRIVGLYGYYTDHKELLFEAVRYEPKGFSQRRPDGRGGHIWNIQGITPLPYHLPELLAAPATAMVLMPEGEKDVETLERLGFVATTTAMGAGKSHLTDLSPLAGRSVVVLPDNDAAGRSHAHKVATHLVTLGCRVKIVELPGLPEKGDASDWVAAGGTKAQLLDLIQTAPRFGQATEPPSEPVLQGVRAGDVPVPPFPMDVFPPAIREYIEAGAKALGCVVDLIAVPFLVYVGAALGNRYEIVIKQSFVQRAILWAAVVAASGKMKTPADTWARLPLVLLQTEAYEIYETEMDSYRTSHREWKRLPEDKRGDEPRKPFLSHVYTTDSTFEALGPILQRTPGLVIAKDEILGWVKSCDAYRGGKGGDRQKYMESWDSKAIKIDRRTQDTIFIARPVLGIAGGIQPDVLPQLTSEASLHDGFIPRFLWTYPDTGDTHWNWDDADDSGAKAIVDLLKRLRLSVPADSVRRCNLHPDARPAWTEWVDDISRIASKAVGLDAAIAAKMPTQVARLALILHIFWNTDDPEVMVSSDRISDAIELGEYFRAHANRVLVHFGSVGQVEGAGLPKRVFRALQRANGEISRTELHRKMGGNVNGDALSDALAALQAAGKIERRVEETPTKPKELWRLSSQERTYEEYEESLHDEGEEGFISWPA